MGRLTLAAIGAAVLALGAAGGALIATALDDDDDERIVTVVEDPTATATATATADPDAGAPSADDDVDRVADIVVDDGIPTAEARDVARRAVDHVGGRAISVDRDDGRYEVDVQLPDGTIVEVLLDGSRRVLGTDRDDLDD